LRSAAVSKAEIKSICFQTGSYKITSIFW